MDIEKTLENLRQRKFQAHFFDTRKEAADYLCREIKNTTVGIGGSKTLEELDIYGRLAENNRVFWHAVTPGQETTDAACSAKVYLSSANAIAETGEIVNIDGRGNRVTATLYGPEKVYIVAGVNKLAPDLDSAIFRARNVAAPKNAQRLKKDTPCAEKADKCYDCRSKERICRGLVILMNAMLGVGSTEIILIGEELGF